VSKQVLIVDDDSDFRSMVSGYLRQNDIGVVAAAGQQDTARLVAQRQFDLMVLDLDLGFGLGVDDGLDLLRRFRADSDVPVIITTGQRTGEVDRVLGLELGADDYILKPLSLRELLARIRTVWRRADTARDTHTIREDGVLRFGSWTLDRRTRRLIDAENEVVPLTRGEYALLTAFLASPRQVLSRERLLQAIRVHEDIHDRSVDVQILRLRRKLEADPSEPRIIRTERGVGYVFDLSVEFGSRRADDEFRDPPSTVAFSALPAIGPKESNARFRDLIN
jgi:DNA-binding response OmpR family regulator